MKGLAVARTSCSSYQWQYITRPLFRRPRLYHIRIQHRIYFRTRIRTTIHPLRHLHLPPPRFSTQSPHYRPLTRILLRLLQSPYNPNQFRLLYIHSFLFRHIEPTMGSSISRCPRHMSAVHTRNNPCHRHCGQRVPTLALHRYRSCQLVCLFQAHPNTSTSISHISNLSIILHNLKRQRVTVHSLREYHIIFVLPRARGQLLPQR